MTQLDSANPYEGILEQLLRTEAREWLRRYADKTKEIGAPLARVWWEDTIAYIEKKRGKPATDMLRAAMNKEVANRKAKK